jgi:hypothetical protein
MNSRKTLAKGIERAGSDIAKNNPKGGDRRYREVWFMASVACVCVSHRREADRSRREKSISRRR